VTLSKEIFRKTKLIIPEFGHILRVDYLKVTKLFRFLSLATPRTYTTDKNTITKSVFFRNLLI